MPRVRSAYRPPVVDVQWDYRHTMHATAPAVVGSRVPQDLLAALRAAVGAANLAVDPDVTAAYSRDMMPLAPSGKPLVVVFPQDTSQVAAVVKACASAGVPIVPRGAGS